MIDQDINLDLIAAARLIWFIRQGVSPLSAARRIPHHTARGICVPPGRFEPDSKGKAYLVLQEMADTVFWHPETGEWLTLNGKAFALNEQAIGNAATYALGAHLNIFETVMDWFRADCDGIVVLNWRLAFDKLRDTPRIAVAERLLPTYRKWMVPARMPHLSVIPTHRRDAA